MFYGSIPAEVQTIMAGIVKDWDCRDIFVGCSGNFTVERLIAPMKKFILHGNDVTFYSNCVGRYLAGENLEIELTEEGENEISWIKNYLKTPADCLATVMLMSGIARYTNRGFNPYYSRMFDNYVKQFPALHAQTLKNIERNETQLADYFNGDVMEFVKKVPENAGFITYPPFKRLGSVFIEDFSRLERLFQFTRPEYTTFNENVMIDYFTAVTEKKYWLISTYLKMPEQFDRYLKAVFKKTNRSIPIHMYANTGKTYYLSPRQETEDLKIPRLMPGDVVGDKIELRLLTPEVFHILRSEYLDKSIVTGKMTSGLGVFTDDKLCGVYAFATPPSKAKWDTYIDTPYIYLLSDFSVEPVDYDRLAKLVLYAALSKESKHQINYGAKMGEWTLDEGLQIWKKKHSQRTGKKESN